MLSKLSIPHVRYRYICFKCNNVGVLQVQKDNHGNPIRVYHAPKCHKCNLEFGKNGSKYEFTEPDIMIGKSVLFVNGTFYHSKEKNKKKDEKQIQILNQMKYKIFVLETEDMEAYPKDINEWLTSVYKSLTNINLYMKLCRGKHGLILPLRANYSFFIEQKLEDLKKDL